MIQSWVHAAQNEYLWIFQLKLVHHCLIFLNQGSKKHPIKLAIIIPTVSIIAAILRLNYLYFSSLINFT